MLPPLTVICFANYLVLGLQPARKLLDVLTHGTANRSLGPPAGGRGPKLRVIGPGGPYSLTPVRAAGPYLSGVKPRLAGSFSFRRKP